MPALTSCTAGLAEVPNAMQSSGDSYHLEINGIAEGPMTVRDLVWKIGMANSDDVILFRLEGSADWQPLEGNRERLQQLATGEPAQAAAPASPPKLKLKKRCDAPSPNGNETPPPFPSEPPTPPSSLETPPPPPGAPVSPVLPEGFEYTDDNPPPPPGAPGYHPPPPAAARHAAARPAVQPSHTGSALCAEQTATPARPHRHAADDLIRHHPRIGRLHLLPHAARRGRFGPT